MTNRPHFAHIQGKSRQLFFFDACPWENGIDHPPTRIPRKSSKQQQTFTLSNKTPPVRLPRSRGANFLWGGGVEIPTKEKSVPRDSYCRTASESYRCDSDRQRSLEVRSPPNKLKFVLADPAFVVLRFESRDWRSLVQHSFHVELRNGLRELTAFAER